MKIVKAVIIIMLLGCLGFVLYRALGNNSQTQNSDIVSAGYRNIESRLRISGIILPHKEIEIKSTISGVLEKLLIHIGDEVDLGQPIARVQYVKDPMEHKQLQSQLEVAKEKLDHAEAIFRRTEDLYRKGVITLEEYENEKSNLIKLRKKINTALIENDYIFVRITGGLLLKLEGSYSILDFMCEFRKNSEVIIVSKNKKGVLNQILLTVDLLKKSDLNLKEIVYKNGNSHAGEEKEENGVIEKISKITEVKYREL